MKYTSPHKRTIDFSKKPLIMGILNVTPDSFYANSRVMDNVEEVARKMIDEGADILDIGGESTRPGAEPVSVDEELSRVIPAIRKIRSFSDILISIDTYKAEVAKEAIREGADIINDISGFSFDPAIVEVAEKFQAPYVLMHIKGTPRDMQKNPYYENVVREVLNYLEKKIKQLVKNGVNQIIVDPGIGFGKRYEDNFELLKNIDTFRELGYPILVGHSRKSFIGWALSLDEKSSQGKRGRRLEKGAQKSSHSSEEVQEISGYNRQVLDIPDPGKRLYGTLGITSYLVLKGVEIIRVHDIKPNYDVVRVLRIII